MSLPRTVIVALLAALVCATPAGATRGLQLGFFDGAFGTDSPPDAPRLDDAAAVGAGIVRIPVSWSAIARTRPASPADPADPAYDWRALDSAVLAANVRDLKILLSFGSAPAWAEGAHRPASAPAGSWRPDPQAVGDFATALARRYQNLVHDIQVWNEPNLSNYLSPQWVRHHGHYRKFAPARYRAMLNAAYPGVHAVGLRLVTAGTAPYGDPFKGGRRIMPVRFWRAVLEHKTHFDVLAHHPYGVGGPRTKAFNADDVAIPDVHKLVSLVRSAVRDGTALPHKRKRYWVTEMSWDTKPPDPYGISVKRQAHWLSDAFYVLWKQGVSAVFWYQVRDQPPVPDYSATNQSGVYFLDGARKPSARAYAFPFACEKAKHQRTRVWLHAPRTGRVRIVDSRGRTVRRLRAGSGLVATGRVPSRRRLHAVLGSRKSLSCRGR